MSDATPDPQVPLSQAYVQEAEQAQKAPARIAFLVTRVIIYALWVIVLSITLLLVLGFFLQLLGANPDAGFVDWVYRSTDEIMEPFRGVFEPRTFSDESVFDPSMLFAAIVYLFVALLIDVTVLRWIRNQIQRQDAQIADLRTRARDAAAMEYYAAQQAQQARQAQAPGTTTTVTQTTVAPPAAAPPPAPAPTGPSSLAPLVQDTPAPPQPGQSGWPV